MIPNEVKIEFNKIVEKMMYTYKTEQDTKIRELQKRIDELEKDIKILQQGGNL